MEGYDEGQCPVRDHEGKQRVRETGTGYRKIPGVL